MATAELAERIDFRLYGKILFKRRWTIATFFIIVVTLVTLITLVQTPIYKATSVIQIEPAPPEIVSFKDVVTLGSQNIWANKEYYQTQFWIIRSEPLAQEVAEALDLIHTDPYFANSSSPARQLSRMISVQPVKNSQLVSIGVVHPDPEQAARICNMLSAHYQLQNVDYRLKQEISQDVLDWLDQRSSSNETNLREAERGLLDFMKTNDIVSFEGRQNIVLQRLTDLSQALTEAHRKRVETEAAYKKVKNLNSSGKAIQLPEVTDNNLIQELKEERILLEKQVSELSEKYKYDHPKMKKLQKQIDLLNAKISEEIANIIGSIHSTYLIARAREKALEGAVTQAKAEAQILNEKAMEYSVLKRKVDSESDIYSELVRRANETRVTQDMQFNNNIIIREKAEAPRSPIKPKRKTNVMLAALLGLFGGVAIAFLLEYLDTTIKSQEDVEDAVGLPFLGVIPSFTADEPEPTSELFTYTYPKSSITESIRSIRTNILFSAAEAPLKKLLVTSAGPQEGKSTTVINLGIIFAQGGKRVLIVDSDLRRPRIHKAFNVTRDRGLTNLIMNEAKPEQVIVNTKVPNLSVIPCGPIPPNPSELLGLTRMQEIIDELGHQFDIILFDSPPIVAVTDAVVLSKKVDGVVLIIKAGRTTSEMVLKAKKQLTDVTAHILGAVLNDFNIRGEGYRYYYYYHYYRSEESDRVKKKVKRKSGRIHSSKDKLDASTDAPENLDEKAEPRG